MADRQKLHVDIQRASRKHFASSYYPFPAQFLYDQAPALHDLLLALSDPETAGNVDELQLLLTRGLAERYAAGYTALTSQHKLLPSLSFTHHRAETPHTLFPHTRLTSLHFHYGPYPIPPTYKLQTWGSMTLAIPPTDAEFISYPHQRRVLAHAQDAGVFIRATVRVDAEIEFHVRDKASGISLVRDKRPFFHVQFISPHFTPFDEIFEVGEAENDNGIVTEDTRGGAKGWRLKWRWRVSDVDHLLESENLVQKGEKVKINFRDRSWGEGE